MSNKPFWSNTIFQQPEWKNYINLEMHTLGNPLTTRPVRMSWVISIELFMTCHLGWIDNRHYEYWAGVVSASILINCLDLLLILGWYKNLFSNWNVFYDSHLYLVSMRFLSEYHQVLVALAHLQNVMHLGYSMWFSFVCILLRCRQKMEGLEKIGGHLSMVWMELCYWNTETLGDAKDTVRWWWDNYV
jgi:hypothetical protein